MQTKHPPRPRRARLWRSVSSSHPSQFHQMGEPDFVALQSQRARLLLLRQKQIQICLHGRVLRKLSAHGRNGSWKDTEVVLSPSSYYNHFIPILRFLKRSEKRLKRPSGASCGHHFNWILRCSRPLRLFNPHLILPLMLSSLPQLVEYQGLLLLHLPHPLLYRRKMIRVPRARNVLGIHFLTNHLHQGTGTGKKRKKHFEGMLGRMHFNTQYNTNMYFFFC